MCSAGAPVCLCTGDGSKQIKVFESNVHTGIHHKRSYCATAGTNANITQTQHTQQFVEFWIKSISEKNSDAAPFGLKHHLRDIIDEGLARAMAISLLWQMNCVKSVESVWQLLWRTLLLSAMCVCEQVCVCLRYRVNEGEKKTEKEKGKYIEMKKIEKDSIRGVREWDSESVRQQDRYTDCPSKDFWEFRTAEVCNSASLILL